MNRRSVIFINSLSLKAVVFTAGMLVGASAVWSDDGVIDNTGHAPLPTGQYVTPTTTPGSTFTTLNPGLAAHPNFRANGAIKTAVSPDGSTLLVLTSGYNLLTNAVGTGYDATSQYLFVYDIAGNYETSPILEQVIQVADTYVGLAWAPDTSKFYVSGGTTDNVFVYANSPTGWTLSTAIPLGHTPFVPTTSPYYGLVLNGIGFEEESTVAGLGLSADGTVLIATNIYNDSISVVDTPTNTVRYEYDLRPYNTSGTAGVAGGEVPFAVALVGTSIAYVSSIRDREVDVVSIAGTTPSLITRISLPGNPNSMVLSADQSTLYVTQDNSDSVAVIDTLTNTVTEEISTIAPPGLVPSGTKYTGAAANNLALSPDGQTLFVTNGGANSLAVISLAGPAPHAVTGLVPTAWYPHSVSVSSDGSMLYVSNGKTDPGSDPLYETGSANEYVLQLEGGGLSSIPVPTATALPALTAQVAANNGYSATANANDVAVMAALHRNIQHIIYIIKENRTFDQILGDLTNGSNADSALVMYGKRVTPNFHALAQNFVTLDNFFCSGEVSGNGWAWSTEGRESDHGTKTIPLNYASRGASNDSEGTNRDVDVGFPTAAGRDAALGGHGLYYAVANNLKGGYPNLLPGTNNDFATDGPNGQAQTGYLWDAAIRAGLSVRNYGFLIDISLYNLPTAEGGLVPSAYPQYGYLESPYLVGVKVATSTNPTLQAYTDPYYWGFDNSYPDAWRVQEWQRDYATYVPGSSTYVTGRTMPTLTLLRIMHDHTGNFGGTDPAVAGLSTPELQQADNDYAVGQVVQTVAKGPYAGNTLIFVLEDDAQDGPDHMDAHRSTAYIVGPYVKQHAVVSTRYSTVNLVRTIEDILGADHLNLNDAYQRPMTDVFNLSQTAWNYTGTISPYLSTTLIGKNAVAAKPSVRFADSLPAKPARSPQWWARATRGFDWSDADKVAGTVNEEGAYNQIEWQGVRPGVPYPTHRSGQDLRVRHEPKGSDEAAAAELSANAESATEH